MAPDSLCADRPHSPVHDEAQEHSNHRLIILPYPEKVDEPPHNSHPDITIPKMKHLESRESLSTQARGLVGKFVDEFGNILDRDGTVLGCVKGDLPSMVGRPISASGEVLDSSGEAVGCVSENHINPRLKDLESGLKVNESGNIYNRRGIIVGKINDPSAHTDENPRRQASAERTGTSSSPATLSPSEVYLDVKSTHDGIQLIIKIPTVFNRENKFEVP